MKPDRSPDEDAGLRGRPWRRPMQARDPGEPHRQASFLELFFDLCFVVAVAAVAERLHHALLDGHAVPGVIGYLLVFFAIWWAWMGFTWFASAYDVDDVPYRISAFVQITGVLILAAGVPRAFDALDFRIVFVGYAVMRVGLIAQRLRAARADPAARMTLLRYAGGEAGAQIGWAIVVFALPGPWILPGWLVMAAVELAVPVWAERARPTTWHPRHIAERYGLFTIIVLGESVLAATLGVQSALGARAGVAELAPVLSGGLLTVFSMWYLYFAKDADRFLTSNRVAFVWGYGHYLVFASAAAVGAGLTLGIDHAVGQAGLSDAAAGATVTVPVAIFLCVLWFLHVRPHALPFAQAAPYVAGAVGVLAVTFTPWPVLSAGLVLAALVGTSIVLSARAHRRWPAA